MAELPAPQSNDFTPLNESLPESPTSIVEGVDSTASSSATVSFPGNLTFPPERPHDVLSSGAGARAASRASKHTRSATSLNKLPAFTFNPGASIDTAAGQDRTRPSSASAPPAPESPSKGRHRRTTSELVGGHIAVRHPSLSPIKVENIGTDDRRLNTFGDAVSQQGHRHRRSHSRLSPDVSPPPSHTESEVAEQRALQCTNENPTHSPFETRVLLDTNVGDVDSTSSTVQVKAKRRVDLGESILVEPRPLSETSDESESSLSTLKDAPMLAGTSSDVPLKSTAVLDTNENTSRPDGELTDKGILAFVDRSEILTIGDPLTAEAQELDVLLLDVNFDDDPTSAIVEGDESRSNIAALDARVLPQPNPVVPDSANDKAVIDLNHAVEGLDYSQDSRGMQIRSFQNARRSMHSSGIMSGFMGPGMHYHRRAESAPLLAPFTYERHLDGAASVKGHAMENVFEEEEEETTPGSPECGQSQPTSPRGQAKELSPRSESMNKRSISPRKGLVSEPITVAAPTTLPPQENAEQKNVPRHQLSNEDQELNPPVAPFLTPDTPSSRSFSSRPGQGSSDQSISFGLSADDVPSLVSGASTWASGPPQSPDPGSSAASTSTLARTEQQRAKRSSLVSLSRLMGGSNAEERRIASPEYAKRSQSTEVLGRRKKATQPRLSRLFRFWKGKHSEPT